jgi:predicted flap endonuclease-1-like 5' DNA nuclease
MTFWTGLLIGLLLGWVIEWLIDWFFWRRRAEETTAADPDLQQSLAEADSRYSALAAESETRLRDVGREWQARVTALETANRDLKLQLDQALAAAAAAPIIAEAVSEAPAKTPKPRKEKVAPARAAEFELPPVIDDLTTIEGIGPTYAARLRVAGINSYQELASSDEARLAAAINAAPWQKVSYADWIRQAQLAVAGDTEGLRALQDELNVRPKGVDNLASIAGIGERTQEALRAAGITTFAALAAASPEQLSEALGAAGIRAGDTDAWIADAKLRAAGMRVRSSHRRPVEQVRCPQDLSAVSGIGPVFEERLYRAGIGTYWEVAEMRNSDLAAVLGEPADYDAIRASALQRATETNSVGRAWDGTPPDDFETMIGIGEVYEKRLYEAGICTYEALAALSKERLAEICAAPKGRVPDYDGWIAEAYRRAAARGTGEE